MPETESPEPEKLPEEGARVELYVQNAEFVRAYLEWRHKLIGIYFLSSGGIFLGAKWFWESRSFWFFTFSPFVIGAIFCFALCAMNKVNKEIFKNAYSIGKEIETKMGAGKGIFTYMSERVGNDNSITYSKILKHLFFWSGIAYAGIAVFAFVAGLLILAIKFIPHFELLAHQCSI